MVSIGLFSIQWIGQADFLILIQWIVIYLLNNSHLAGLEKLLNFSLSYGQAAITFCMYVVTSSSS